MKRATLYCIEGAADKIYILTLDAVEGGYVVQGFYGRRGNILKPHNKTPNGPVSLYAANDIYADVLREKLGKGYSYADSTPAGKIALDDDSPTGVAYYQAPKPIRRKRK
jgi:hypothetical protein